MLVGYNVDGDKAHHLIEADSDDHVEAIAAVNEMLKEEGIKARRVLGIIQGGKQATVPVLELPPTVA